MNAMEEPLLETAVIHNASDDYVEAMTRSNDEQDHQPAAITWFDYIIIWIILPVLLLFDFSLALFIQPGDGTDENTLNIRMVQLSIALFIVASYMYRRTLQEAQELRALFVLMPEIAIDVVLLMILLGQLMLAFQTLLCSIGGLSVVVMAYNVRSICGINGGNEPKKLLDTGLEGTRGPLIV